MKLAKYLTDSFYMEGIISDEDKTIIYFGLESLAGNLLSATMILLVGSLFKHTKSAFLLWLLLFPLRKNSGGYHAATKTRCLFISLIMIITAFVIFTKFKFTLTFYGISAAINGCIIWILAPIDNSSKKFDAIEFNVYQKRSRVILVIECIIIILSLYLGWEVLLKSSSMALFIASVLLLIGRFKKEGDDAIENVKQENN